MSGSITHLAGVCAFLSSAACSDATPAPAKVDQGNAEIVYELISAVARRDERFILNHISVMPTGNYGRLELIEGIKSELSQSDCVLSEVTNLAPTNDKFLDRFNVGANWHCPHRSEDYTLWVRVDETGRVAATYFMADE